jgi:hypothetical protein
VVSDELVPALGTLAPEPDEDEPVVVELDAVGAAAEAVELRVFDPVTRCDCAAITIAIERNSATASATAHLRIARARRRRAAIRAAASARGSSSRRTGRGEPGSVSAEVLEGVMVMFLEGECWNEDSIDAPRRGDVRLP